MDTDAVIEHRLALLSERFGWTPPRIAAFREGLADQRAGKAYDPSRDLDRGEDASFDDASCTSEEISAIGYRCGLPHGG